MRNTRFILGRTPSLTGACDFRASPTSCRRPDGRRGDPNDEDRSGLTIRIHEPIPVIRSTGARVWWPDPDGSRNKSSHPCRASAEGRCTHGSVLRQQSGAPPLLPSRGRRVVRRHAAVGQGTDTLTRIRGRRTNRPRHDTKANAPANREVLVTWAGCPRH